MSKLFIRTRETAFRPRSETLRSLRVPTDNVFNRLPSESLESWEGKKKSWRAQPREDELTDDNRPFSTIFADSPALLEVAHALRFQIYCRERNFENGDEYPDGQEMDAYDANSIQGVLFHRSTCAAIGIVRIILPKRVAGDSFPIEKILRAQSLDLSNYVKVTQSAEVSRFAISKEFRRRVSGQLDTSVHTSRCNGRETDLAFLSLLQFALHQSLKRKLLFWTAVMEPKLLRLLASYGISYRNIGTTVEHHGIRQPCYGYIPETLDTVRRVRPDCWEVLTDDGAPRVGYGHSAETVPVFRVPKREVQGSALLHPEGP